MSGKLVHIWMSFPEIGVCHALEFTKITSVIFRLFALFWMSFSEIGPCLAA